MVADLQYELVGNRVCDQVLCDLDTGSVMEFGLFSVTTLTLPQTLFFVNPCTPRRTNRYRGKPSIKIENVNKVKNVTLKRKTVSTSTCARLTHFSRRINVN